MKNIVTLLCVAISLLFGSYAKAQSFHMTADTVYFTITSGGVTNVNDHVVPGTGSDTLRWNVVATNFPADWLRASGICDNFNCYNVSTLWPSGTVKQSDGYATGGNLDFHLQLNQDTAQTTGTYYIRTKLMNTTHTDTVYATFVVSRIPAGINNVNNLAENVNLYPNPANNSANLSLSLKQNAKVSVFVYDAAGRMVYAADRGQMTSGQQNITIPVSNLAAGNYSVMLAIDNGRKTLPLTVIK